MRLFPLLLLAACGSPPEPPPTSTGLDKEVVSGLKQRIRDQADAYDATYNKALADLDGWPSAGDAPCPHALPVPGEAAAAGETPLQAVVDQHGEGDTPIRIFAASDSPPEESEIARTLRSWAARLTWPGATEDTLRAAVDKRLGAEPTHEILFREDLGIRPSFDGGGTFSPGRSVGRAYLVDHKTGRAVCAADVDVTNGPAVRSELDEDAIVTRLELQLHQARLRAIALGLRQLSVD